MMSEPFGFLYDVGKEKEMLGKSWIYDKDRYPHMEEVRVAVLHYDSGEEGSLQWAEIFVASLPAKFLTIRCHLNSGDVIVLSTGSGSTVEYLEMVLPILKLWGEDMFKIRGDRVYRGDDE